MDVLNIALIVLAIAGIWAIVELALAIRKTRSAIDDINGELGEIAANANDTILQLQPTIERIDGMAEDLEPAVQQITPLIEKANTAIDVVTVDLASVNDILVDVSSVTDTASNVTSTVSKAANSAVSGVAGVVGKFTGGGKSHRRRKLAAKSVSTKQEEVADVVGPETQPEADAPVEETPRDPKTYYSYNSDSKDE